MAASHLTQNVFGMVRDGFQRGEGWKAAGTFNGVERTENTGQQLSVFWALLQFDHLAIQTT